MTRPLLATTRDALVDARTQLVAAGRRGDVAAVLTMGALHDGHAALVDEARARVGATGIVVMTIFVNPLQFGPGEDLDRYPRTLDSDLALAGQRGVDVVFAPTAAEMYPDGRPAVTVHPGPLGDELDGAVRPGHFAGVLTVVCKLLNITVPALTCFGEKDYQQLVLVRRMCDDLDLGVEVVGVPIVREPDGLALSSRNRYLDPQQRATAVVLSRALAAGAAAGVDGAAAVDAAAHGVLAKEDGAVDVDYLALRAPDLTPAPEQGAARLLIAARVGATRLIDNVAVELGPGAPGAAALTALASSG